MAYRRIDRFELGPENIEALRNMGIATAQDLLDTAPVEVMVRCGVSLAEAQLMIAIVSQNISPIATTALELFTERSSNNQSYILTGSRILDSCLHGGLRRGCITEIVGPPGVGKSQFCFGCCVQAIKSGLTVNSSGGVIYIDTELKFDPSRLNAIAENSSSNLKDGDPYNGDEFSSCSDQAEDILRRVQVYN